MNDCPNAEIRDQLPDLLHERLSPSARAVVTVHVGTCADCRDELELLRGVHGMLGARTPRVDIAPIVAALPKPPVADTKQVRPMRRRRTWSDWRIAATVTLLVAGGSSVIVYNRAGTSAAKTVAQMIDNGTPTRSPAHDAAAQRPVDGPERPVAATSTTQPSATVAMATPEQGPASGLGMSGRLADLDDRQLEALLNEIDHLEAVPITEPDPVSIRIEARNATPPNGGGIE